MKAGELTPGTILDIDCGCEYTMCIRDAEGRYIRASRTKQCESPLCRNYGASIFFGDSDIEEITFRVRTVSSKRYIDRISCEDLTTAKAISDALITYGLSYEVRVQRDRGFLFSIERVDPTVARKVKEVVLPFRGRSSWIICRTEEKS